MLERDVWMSELDPARHTAGLFLRGGGCVGVLDWVDAGPTDGLPWVGLVMVHADSPAALALLASAGMRELERRTHRFAAGERSVVVCEREL